MQRTDRGVHCRIAIPRTSPYFEGHFPDRPIVPGVAQVQIVTDVLVSAIGHDVTWRGVEQLRFRKPLEPDVEFEVDIDTPNGSGSVAFAIRTAAGLHTDGILRTTERPAERAGGAP
ncbi:MAG: hypothetical protein KDC87_18040 [Planctomycetes bacterium]|nr:hypothetical protein [Planctomycetota bacterium]MCB9872443.1 hypothetical protein [Planctomycetota bacterium]